MTSLEEFETVFINIAGNSNDKPEYYGFSSWIKKIVNYPNHHIPYHMLI